MGKYYALAQGEDAAVAAAIEEHYKPAGPNDRVPTDPVSIAVALADKIDTLVGFWAIDEKPTGSKDPYALRRAALGVIRIVLDNALRLKLLKDRRRRIRRSPAIANDLARRSLPTASRSNCASRARATISSMRCSRSRRRQDDLAADRPPRRGARQIPWLPTTARACSPAYKRAANILRIEEKKDGTTYHGRPDPHLYLQPEERAACRRDPRREGRGRQGGRAARTSRARWRRSPSCARCRCVLRQGDGQRAEMPTGARTGSSC